MIPSTAPRNLNDLPSASLTHFPSFLPRLTFPPLPLSSAFPSPLNFPRHGYSLLFFPQISPLRFPVLFLPTFSNSIPLNLGSISPVIFHLLSPFSFSYQTPSTFFFNFLSFSYSLLSLFSSLTYPIFPIVTHLFVPPYPFPYHILLSNLFTSHSPPSSSFSPLPSQHLFLPFPLHFSSSAFPSLSCLTLLLQAPPAISSNLPSRPLLSFTSSFVLLTESPQTGAKASRVGGNLIKVLHNFKIGFSLGKGSILLTFFLSNVNI